MTWEDRYHTDRILNKLHQISPHFRLRSLVLTRQASSFSEYSAPALWEKLQNVLIFHNKEQFKGATADSNHAGKEVWSVATSFGVYFFFFHKI